MKEVIKFLFWCVCTFYGLSLMAYVFKLIENPVKEDKLLPKWFVCALQLGVIICTLFGYYSIGKRIYDMF